MRGTRGGNEVPCPVNCDEREPVELDVVAPPAAVHCHDVGAEVPSERGDLSLFALFVISRFLMAKAAVFILKWKIIPNAANLPFPHFSRKWLPK